MWTRLIVWALPYLLKFLPILIVLSGIATVLTGTHWWAYKKGKAVVQRLWDEQVRIDERARDLDRIRRSEKGEAIAATVIEYRDKERIVYRNIIKKVVEYVPIDSCPLPSGWRLLHDAAAEGRDPAPASSPDAAPVPAQDAAATVIENYEGCRDNARRLEGLQQWAREVTQ